ncbi:helix-turn-helix transcriptional regulator [Isoptericola sp. b515]|uniref:helix-turn-helix domain-containing protein n=1 Tax=Isoptericola sp. b515 TaxID=3064652 RepID=UPI002712DA40|nr:helix-turn-helix transcriptional regulator [Isoptericola sp. b515]MDO8148291.1 helix-turn-helix transcriptional regulator [Isoptericola sp. b515]
MTPRDDATDGPPHRVVAHLDRLLERRGLTLAQLAESAGVTVANLSVLKNNRARAIRFSTLTAVCDALGCQPGDLLSVEPGPGGDGDGDRQAGTDGR